MSPITTTTLPRLPRRTRTRTDGTASSPWTPPGGWARPTPAALRAIEAALAQWSA
ncbi:hypothetical protein [Streptomyces mirabilis]|uniref:hypothetical protein n=1 Tax=Streptomyces mirabilis TaxID=68239 RepID=UPI00368AD858